MPPAVQRGGSVGYSPPHLSISPAPDRCGEHAVSPQAEIPGILDSFKLIHYVSRTPLPYLCKTKTSLQRGWGRGARSQAWASLLSHDHTQAPFCVTCGTDPPHTGLYIKKRLCWLTKLKGAEAVPSFSCGWIQSLKRCRQPSLSLSSASCP